jgi:hypothetical protein
MQHLKRRHKKVETQEQKKPKRINEEIQEKGNPPARGGAPDIEQ